MKNSKSENTARLLGQLQDMGFTFGEACQLRRIQMTLHRWDEAECGDSNDFNSWSIERDEETGKPFRCVYPHNGKMHRYPIADREAGAIRRLNKIVTDRNDRTSVEAHLVGDGAPVIAYHQSDCRGCALYIIKASDVHGLDVSAYYTRGIAVAS